MPSWRKISSTAFSDVLIFAVEQLPSGLHDGNAAAESPKKLAEFESDISAAENEQVFGNGIQFHDRSAVQIGNAL